MEDIPYSYHTFLFPFIWNDNGSVKREEFENILSKGKRWVETSWKQESIPTDRDQAHWLQDYAAFQYFTDHARSAIFNTRESEIEEDSQRDKKKRANKDKKLNPREGSVVHCFEYRHRNDTLKGRGEYVINKGDKEFRLDINGIRLHIYDTGIAILVFEMENRQHTSIEFVNQINEYGRRINMPYIPILDENGNPGRHALCADKISIFIDKVLFEQEDYWGTIQRLYSDYGREKENISLNFIMKPIQKILDGDGKDNGGYTLTSNAAHKSENKFFIKPCVDDRMFVCCLVIDKSFVDKIRGKRDTGEYDYLSSSGETESRNECFDIVAPSISTQLYQFMFIENSVSCRSRTMRKKLLTECVYDRWIDDGTVYCATHHSLVCATEVSFPPLIINPFLTMYIQLAILVLAQRATILALSSEAAAVSEGFEANHEITAQEIAKIEQLQAKYVKSQNQMMLAESTVQEQGVEIYALLQQQLYIKENKESLNEQMGNLREVAYISNERLERKSGEALEIMLNVIAFIGLALTVLQIAPFFVDNTIPRFTHVIWIISSILVGGGAVFWMFRIKCEKSRFAQFWRFLVSRHGGGNR